MSLYDIVYHVMRKYTGANMGKYTIKTKSILIEYTKNMAKAMIMQPQYATIVENPKDKKIKKNNKHRGKNHEDI